MNTYIKNLLPRFQQYGKRLDKIEAFVDKVWIVPNTQYGRVSYRFFRNNTLLITKNGDVEEGTWSFLKPNSLYLKFGEEKKMFSHSFVLEDVLLLQMDDDDANPFLMYDAKLGQLDLGAHVKKSFLKSSNLGKIPNTSFYITDYSPYNEIFIGQFVYDLEFELIPNSIISVDNKLVSIDEGLVTLVTYKQTVETDSGTLELQTRLPHNILRGDRVISGGIIGKKTYRIIEYGGYHSFDVEQGTIISVRIKWFKNPVVLLLLFLSMFFLIILIVSIFY